MYAGFGFPTRQNGRQVHGTVSPVRWTVGETAGFCCGESPFIPDGVSDSSFLAADSFARQLFLSLSRLETNRGLVALRGAGLEHECIAGTEPQLWSGCG
jgi:hypothetical protein